MVDFVFDGLIPGRQIVTVDVFLCFRRRREEQVDYVATCYQPRSILQDSTLQ